MRTLQRALTWLSRVTHDPSNPDHHVHFHTGPHGEPVPCFDRGCSNPRRDI